MTLLGGRADDIIEVFLRCYVNQFLVWDLVFMNSLIKWLGKFVSSRI